ncbi:MAG: PaaI family thioesterase [Thermodesulfobacteriota bacterium]
MKEHVRVEKSIQDYYPDDFAICYGCGRLNEHGHHLKSYWDGDELVCRVRPEPYHTGAQNFVYGGLVLSSMDCHGTGAAAAAKHRHEGKELGVEPLARFVTASLKVDFLAPVPIDGIMEIRARIKEIKERKVTIAMTLTVDDTLCAKGEMVAVAIPEGYLKKYNPPGKP